MSPQTAPTEQPASDPTSTVEGGRACPLPLDLATLRAAPWASKPQRRFASTGVITADLVGRTFV